MARYALVTGASSGLGRDIAIELAMKGFHVVLCSRNSLALQEVRDHISGLGRDSSIETIDLSNIDETVSRIQELLNKYRNMEIIVNNAGAGIYGPIVEYQDRDIVNIINLNYVSPVIITKYGLAHMIRMGIKGAIVNVSSLIVYTPIPWFSIYTSTKTALKGFTDSIRIEAKPYGIRVIGVYPGYVETSFHRNLIRTKSGEKIGDSGIPRNPLVPRHSSRYVARYVVGKILDEDFNGDVVIGFRYKLLRILAILFSPLIYRSLESSFIKRIKTIEPAVE